MANSAIRAPRGHFFLEDDLSFDRPSFRKPKPPTSFVLISAGVRTVSFAMQNEYLYSSLGTDPDLADLVDLFVQEMPDRVAKLLDSLEAGDWDQLRRAAHQLKGAAGSYGFGQISPSAGRVEEALRSAEPEEVIRDTVAGLVDLCNRARAGSP